MLGGEACLSSTLFSVDSNQNPKASIALCTKINVLFQKDSKTDKPGIDLIV